MTTIGTINNDTLTGTLASEILYFGYTGNDSIYGGNGADTLNGGSGSDSIYGEAGNDEINDNNSTISKDYSNDLMDGGSGNDSLSSTSGVDTLIGGLGDDTLVAYDNDFDNASLYGGDGDDYLFADNTYGNNTLIGGLGDDFLTATGSNGNNILDGGQGADVMIGGDGADKFYADDINDIVADSNVDVFLDLDTLYVNVDNYKTPTFGIENIVYGAGVKKLDYFIDNLLEGSPVGNYYGKSVTLSYSFATTGTSLTGFATYTSAQKEAVRLALSRYSEIAGITLAEVADGTSGAVRFFRDSLVEAGTDVAGYYSPSDNEVHIVNDPDYIDMSIGSFAFQTLMHEIGHALGLKHSFETPALPAAEDTQVNTVMTYNFDSENATQLGMFDLAAIHYQYGVNTNARTGNQTYTFSDRYIWDGTGIDTFSASTQTSAVYMDLTQGGWSYVGSKATSILAAGQAYVGFGTQIENAIGGSGKDTIKGNSLNNNLAGGDGIDVLYGLVGADTLNGGADNDSLYGDSGNDSLLGGSGNDYLDGGYGNNSLVGGTGNDTYLITNKLATGFVINRWETKAGGFWDSQKWSQGDFNGDGKIDLVNVFNDTGSMSADIHLSSGSGFQIQRGETKAGGFWDTQKWATGDFNGDGKTDLVNIFNDNGLMSADVHISNGTNFQIQRAETKAGGFWDSQKWTTGDFNGDGKADLVNVFNDNGTASVDVHLSKGNGFNIQRWETHAGGFWDAQKWLSGDVNGDGITDLINIFNDDGLTSVDVHMSTGTGFQIQRWESKAGGFWDAQQWSIADVNGDGKADLINAFNDNGLMSSDVHVSTGTGFQIQRWETKAGGFWDGQKWSAADVTGDGKADLINIFNDLGMTSVDVHVAGNYEFDSDNNIKSDVVTEATNAGTDTVKTNANHILEANVENLILLDGSAARLGTGNTLNNKLIGNNTANTLSGLTGNDTLQGNKGADMLIGGSGDDTYLFTRGDGADKIIENSSTNGDLLWFTQGITFNQLWFTKSNNDLQINVIGTADTLVVNNWYLGSINHIETIKTSDNKVLLDSKVDALVNAMSNFAVPAAGQTSLPSNYQTSLNSVFAASWA